MVVTGVLVLLLEKLEHKEVLVQKETKVYKDLQGLQVQLVHKEQEAQQEGHRVILGQLDLLDHKDHQVVILVHRVRLEKQDQQDLQVLLVLLELRD